MSCLRATHIIYKFMIWLLSAVLTYKTNLKKQKLISFKVNSYYIFAEQSISTVHNIPWQNCQIIMFEDTTHLVLNVLACMIPVWQINWSICHNDLFCEFSYDCNSQIISY